MDGDNIVPSYNSSANRTVVKAQNANYYFAKSLVSACSVELYGLPRFVLCTSIAAQSEAVAQNGRVVIALEASIAPNHFRVSF